MVYIEYIIIDNMTMNFLLLYLVAKISLTPCKIRALILSAMLGTSVAIALPLVSINSKFEIAIKVLLSFCMILIINTNKKRFFLEMGLFYLLTFAMGGAIIGIFYLLDNPISNLSYITYSNDIPIGIFILVPLCIYFLIVLLLKHIRKNKSKLDNIHICKLVHNNVAVVANALYDSGNCLKNHNGDMVHILSKSLYKKMSKANISKIGNINLLTVTGSMVCSLYKIDYCEVVFDDKLRILNGHPFALSNIENFQGGADILLNADTINL